MITTRGYWKKMREAEVWGFSENTEKRIESIHKGDMAVVYLTADGGRYKSAIGGIVQLSGKTATVESEKKNFFAAMYPIRMDIKVNQVADPPMEFKPFIGRVQFVGKGRFWGSSLQGQPIKPITKEDFDLIKKALEDTVR